MKPEEIVPPQQEGISKDYRFEKRYETISCAREEFELAKNRLLDISNWNKVGGIPTTKLTITDENGVPVNLFAKKGLYVKIDLPGPGTTAGKGNDWVRIEDIKQETGEHEESISMKLRPISSPLNEDDESIAHFFDDKATSNFILKRANNTISIWYAGRNEVANTQAEKVIDKVRNALVATAARLGMSDLQWSTLIKGIINADTDDRL